MVMIETKKIKIKEPAKIIGRVTIKVYKPGTCEKAEEFFKRAKVAHGRGYFRVRDEYCRIGREILDEGYIRTDSVQRNLLMQSPNYGLDIIVQRLVGINTYSLNILFGEIGTGTTTPTVSDTALTAPTNRASVGAVQDYGTTDAILTFFYSDSQLANLTYGEFGTFVDGTAVIGSGQIFNHALLSPNYAKASGQDTQVQVDFNIS